MQKREASNLEGRVSFLYRINTERLYRREAPNLGGRLSLAYRIDTAMLHE